MLNYIYALAVIIIFAQTNVMAAEATGSSCRIDYDCQSYVATILFNCQTHNIIKLSKYSVKAPDNLA